MPPDRATPAACCLTREQVRDLDRRAIAQYGLPGVVLMENAGRNAAELLVRLWPDARRVAIACGRGNNGGDGFVIARHLQLLGRDPRILLAADPGTITGDAAVNFLVAQRGGIPITTLAEADSTSWAAVLASADTVVDALLGTGAMGCPRPGTAAAIEAINDWRAGAPSAGRRVLAIDLPSGLDCDDGHAPGPCVQADATATFVARKPGFDRPAAAAFTGGVHVLDIGAPRQLLAEFGIVRPTP